MEDTRHVPLLGAPWPQPVRGGWLLAGGGWPGGGKDADGVPQRWLSAGEPRERREGGGEGEAVKWENNGSPKRCVGMFL